MSTSEIIMACLALCNLVMVIVAWKRTSRNDTADGAAMDEQTRTDVRYVMRGVDDIRVELRALRDGMTDMDRRLTVVEESCKSAHKRIDECAKQLRGGI